eukprot:TRINITY_DN5853_c0_g1_i1.p1 TRINITY_DN5853_c0_g1~~TRINITY_DN5853_c0_g1_i1.p1  ORF type:complete len:535 (-),score=128.27 TRINITY_DN5853_c0_g1_i1:119-1723(-)
MREQTTKMVPVGFVFLLFLTATLGSENNSTEEENEGFCTTEKESCDGDTDEEKQNYAKIKWTDDKDYLIREQLDKADDEIVPNPAVAVEMFNEILKDHPQSGRANYALARTYQFLIWKTNTTEEKSDFCEKTKTILRNVLSWSDLSEYLTTASAHLFLTIAEKDCFKSKSEGIEALQYIRAYEPDSRFAVVLCHDLFLEERYDEALEQIEDVLSRKPENFLLNILKSTIMKVRKDEKKDVKQANRMLRELDYEETLEGLKKEERMQEGGLLTIDLNYLGVELSKRSRNDIKEIIYKDASRLHLIPSPMQRPLELMKDLKSQPVWELSELQSQNRWTNAQSLTGLGQTSDKLKNIAANLKAIKDEAQEIVKDINDGDTWIEDKTSLVGHGTSYTRGLYLYSKKKHETCSKCPTLCKILKKFPDSSNCKKCISKFVLLRPKTEVLPHVGATNAKLRAILPISVPEGDTGIKVAGKYIKLEEGKIVVIDDSFENNLWNEAQDDLLILSIDFHHPDLKDREKKTGAFTDHVKNRFVIY